MPVHKPYAVLYENIEHNDSFLPIVLNTESSLLTTVSNNAESISSPSKPYLADPPLDTDEDIPLLGSNDYPDDIVYESDYIGESIIWCSNDSLNYDPNYGFDYIEMDKLLDDHLNNDFIDDTDE